MAKAKSSAKKAQVTGGKQGKKGLKRAISKAFPTKKTSGPAPLMPIGGAETSAITFPPLGTSQAASAEDFDILSDGTLTPLPMEEESENPRRSSRLKKQPVKMIGRPAAAASKSPTPDPVPEDVDMASDTESGTRNFCAGCHDGGKLARCEGHILFEDTTPPICGRFMCYGPRGSRRCLELTEAALQTGIEDKNVAFVCPACWNNKTKQSERTVPYEGFFQRDQPETSISNMLYAVHSVRQGFGTLELLPIATIAITLEGMAHEPFDATVVELDSYYRASSVPFLKYSISFDLSSKATLGAYIHEIDSLVKALELHSIKRVIMFITTHSTPDTGLLHFRPNNQGAESVQQVLKILIQAELARYLQSPDVHASLFMLACGGAFMHQGDFDTFTDLVTVRTFRSITAFPAQDLQPLEAARWCQDFVRRVLIQKQSVERALKWICNSNGSLGPHSNVLIWYRSPIHSQSLHELSNQKPIIKRVVWYHHKLAPCGIRITDTWCSTCHCLGNSDKMKPLLIKEGDEEFVVLPCRSNTQPPISGQRGGPVSQFSPPCPPILKVRRTGVHLQIPFGNSNTLAGEWKVFDYKWPTGKGDDHVEHF
ncbi:hypothetical protein EV360DRAFT_80065 [Lentinula raphanica]|nr:hypothetical protein EV360DRAFT_80065 [Lentinula raphanica]